MQELNPLKSLHFFENNLPSFLNRLKPKINKLIIELIEILEHGSDGVSDPAFDAALLSSVKKLYKIILIKGTEVLSKATQSPYLKTVNKMEKSIDDFSRFEELIMGFDLEYRDHICHSLWVYLFGHEMIKSLCEYDQIKIAGQLNIHYHEPAFILGSETVKCKVSEYETMWAVIALLHDIGYPVERVSNEPSAIFGELLDSFGIDFYSAFQIDFGSRLFMLYESICDLLATMYRPKELSDDEKEKYIEQANQIIIDHGPIGIPFFIRKPTTSINDYQKIEFRIASVNRKHSAWGAIFAYKNIPFFQQGRSKGGGDPDFKPLMISRDILYSIVHHTHEQPRDEVVNRFQFILLLIDDIEECLRYGKGGKERGRTHGHTEVRWDIQQAQMQVEMEFNSKKEANQKYQELSKRYDYQKSSVVNGNYPISIKFFLKNQQTHIRELKLLLLKEQSFIFT